MSLLSSLFVFMVRSFTLQATTLLELRTFRSLGGADKPSLAPLTVLSTGSCKCIYLLSMEKVVALLFTFVVQE